MTSLEFPLRLVVSFQPPSCGVTLPVFRFVNDAEETVAGRFLTPNLVPVEPGHADTSSDISNQSETRTFRFVSSSIFRAIASEGLRVPLAYLVTVTWETPRSEAKSVWPIFFAERYSLSFMTRLYQFGIRVSSPNYTKLDLDGKNVAR